MEVRRKLSARPIAASEARVLVRTFAGVIPTPLVEDLAVIVSELATNVVTHSGLSPEDAFEVRVSMQPSVLRVEIRDEGAVEISGSAEHLAGESMAIPESGRGLQLVEALSSRWSIEKVDGTAAWAEIDLPTTGTQDA